MSPYLTNRGGVMSPTYVPPQTGAQNVMQNVTRQMISSPPTYVPPQMRAQNAPQQMSSYLQPSVFDTPERMTGLQKQQQLQGYDKWWKDNNAFTDAKGNVVIGVDPRNRAEYLHAQGGYRRPEYYQMMSMLMRGQRGNTAQPQQPTQYQPEMSLFA